MQYLLITSYNPLDLEKKVNAQMKAGFKPLGSVAMQVIPQEEGGCEIIYAQALSK